MVHCALLLLVPALALGTAAVDAKVDAIHAAYSGRMAAIGAAHRTELDRLYSLYLAELGKLGKKARAAGDLDGALTIREELTRASGDALVPDSELVQNHGATQRLQRDYQRAYLRALVTHARQIVTLTAQRQSALYDLQLKLTRNNRIDDALVVKERRLTLKVDPAYALATNTLIQTGCMDIRLVGDEAGPVSSHGAPTIDLTAQRDGELVLHYRFDDMSGSRIPDSSTHDHEGKADDLKPLATGSVGQAALFGENSYINAGTSPALSMSRAFTLAFWARRDPKRNQLVFATKQRDLRTGWRLFADDGVLMFWSARAQPDIRVLNPLADDRWHHLALIVERDEVTLYVDGTNAARGKTLILPNDVPLLLGARFEGAVVVPAFEGALDDVRVYDFAIPEATIRRLTSP